MSSCTWTVNPRPHRWLSLGTPPQGISLKYTWLSGANPRPVTIHASVGRPGTAETTGRGLGEPAGRHRTKRDKDHKQQQRYSRQSTPGPGGHNAWRAAVSRSLWYHRLPHQRGGRSVAVNASGCGPEDRGFDPLRPPHPPFLHSGFHGLTNVRTGRSVQVWPSLRGFAQPGCNRTVCVPTKAGIEPATGKTPGGLAAPARPPKVRKR